MKTVIYGQDERVTKWVGERLDEDFGQAVGIGIEDDGELIGGVVFNLYSGPSIAMNVAAEAGKYWLTRDFLWRCFAYPFLQLGCFRVTALVKTDNYKSQKLVEHLGYKREGVLRRAHKDGTDMIVYGMLKEECRWLEIKR